MVLCCALGCCGSCAGACGSYCLCKACEGCIPKKNNARYHYAFLTLLSCVVATILQQFGDYPLFMTDFKICSLINADRCKKNASVFRIFTVLSLFFFIHVIMVRVWKSFQKHGWLIKLLAFSVSVLVCYFIPNSVFEGYATFGIFGAGIFIVIQIVVLINMLYECNDSWLSKEWKIQILMLTFLMYAIAGVFYGLSFAFYGHEGCIRNLGNIVASVILSAVLSVLSIFAPHGAILPSAGVTLYLAWTLFRALSHDSSEKCNTGNFSNRTQTCIGLIIMCLSVGYFCVSSSSNIESEDDDNDEKNKKDIELINGGSETKIERKFSLTDDNDTGKPQNNVKNAVKEKADESMDDITAIKISIDSNENTNVEKERGGICSPADEVQAKNVVFHILMFFGSLFIMMTLTGWDTVSQNDGRNAAEKNSSLVIGIIAHWAVVLLYLVTLTAPLLFPDRFPYADTTEDDLND